MSGVTIPVHSDWHRDGACHGRDPDIWFPEPGGSVALAVRICSGCSVKTLCLEEALANNELFGVFGGVTAEGRRRGGRRPKTGTSREKVEAIRLEHKLLTDQGVTRVMYILASKYGISRSNIGLMVTGRTYPDYPGPIHTSSRTKPFKRNRVEAA